MTYLPQPAGVGTWLSEPPPRPRSVTVAASFMYACAVMQVRLFGGGE